MTTMYALKRGGYTSVYSSEKQMKRKRPVTAFCSAGVSRAIGKMKNNKIYKLTVELKEVK